MIGRADDCALKPRSEMISRYHCAIVTEEGYAGVRDLGSKNGVYVNGERVYGERELTNGDALQIGPLQFEVVLSVALKGPAKPKVESIADAVARTVEQNAINVAAARQAYPNPAPAPVAPPTPAPVPEPAAPAASAAPAPAPAKAPDTGPASTDDDDLADWLMGGEESSDAVTAAMALDELDLPYTPKEEEAEEKPSEKAKPAAPSSSDAAANLLRNFFKGGR